MSLRMFKGNWAIIKSSLLKAHGENYKYRSNVWLFRHLLNFFITLIFKTDRT